MVGSPATKARDGLIVRLADLVVARVLSPAGAIQLVGRLSPCVIRPCGKKLAQSR